jgi:hypothetical protein
MYIKKLMILLGILVGAFCGLASSAAVPPKAATGVDVPEVVHGAKKILDGPPPPLEEHRVDLAPFFLLQQKGPYVWLERVIVRFMMAAPKDALKDMHSPKFRKIIYELLHSGKPAALVQEQAVAGLNRQLNMNLEATVQVSRSVIIAH